MFDARCIVVEIGGGGGGGDGVSDGDVPPPPPPWRHGIFSDWTLYISGAAYPVHRYVLGLGPRSSPLLARIFQSGSFSDQTDQSTTIELEHTCPKRDLSLQEIRQRFASAADSVLSYMYYGADINDLHLKVFIPLWRLADYLCLYQLVDIIKAAFPTMVDANNIADVLNDADCFGLADECAQICSRRIARRFTFINNDVWDRLPPKFLSEILRSPRLLAPGNYVSERLALYLQRHPSEREHHDLLVRSLLDNPRHQISPQDGAFFLSLNVCHDLLVNLVAEHFQMFPRDSLCQLPADVFLILLSHRALRHRPDHLVDLTLISYVRKNLHQLSVEHLAVLLQSTIDPSTRAKLIIDIVYSPYCRPSFIDVCIISILDAIHLHLGPVCRAEPDLVSIGYGIWVKTDPNARFLAFESPSPTDMIQLCPVNREAYREILTRPRYLILPSS